MRESRIGAAEAKHGEGFQNGTCGKIRATGKACGNTCTSRNYTCHKGPGCARNGY